MTSFSSAVHHHDLKTPLARSFDGASSGRGVTKNAIILVLALFNIFTWVAWAVASCGSSLRTLKEDLALGTVQSKGAASTTGSRQSTNKDIYEYLKQQRNETNGLIVVVNEKPYVRPQRIFGHLHFAKTGGTEVNGELAAKYERVCGHKGFSYDAYQFNKRAGTVLEALEDGSSSVHLRDLGGMDLVSKNYPKYNRGRVPASLIREIGFEDCDMISLEERWHHWLNVSQHFAPLQFELHVPCRDPLQHLMSQCNYRHKIFHCDADDLKEEIAKCIVKPERFDISLEHNPFAKNLELRCFNPIPIDPYIDYMGQFLQTKRFPVEYVRRESNSPRQKDRECIWKEPEIAKKVETIMVEHFDLYKWCHECLGSERDLLANA